MAQPDILTTCPSLARGHPRRQPGRVHYPFRQHPGANYGRLEQFVVFVRDTDGVPAAGLLCDSTHPFVRFNTFKGYWGDRAETGILLLNSSEALISTNSFASRELAFGVRARGASRPDIEANTFAVGETGISVTDDARPTIKRNTITAARPDFGVGIWGW